MTKGKLIGKGAFSYVYDQGEEVFIESIDPIKECMAHGWFPDHPLFPVVEFSDKESCWDDYYCYTMKKYNKVKSLKSALEPDQYQLYKELVNIFKSVPINGKSYDGLNIIIGLFNNSSLSDEIKEVMIEAAEACGNYGSDVGFEISPRNVAADNGKLVLLDVFFIKSALRRQRSNK